MKALTAIIFASCLIYGVSCLKIVVSGYNTKIAVYDVIEGGLSLSAEYELGSDGKDMTWLQLDGNTIWGGHEVGDYDGVDGSVISKWQIIGDGFALDRLDFTYTGSIYTAHLLVDKNQGKAYAANYGGSAFSVIGLSGDDFVGTLETVFDYSQESCRDASHPHQTFTKDNFVWVVDLGCDMIRHYMIIDGNLEPLSQTQIRAGAGPRHAVFHPTENLMFLLCELQSYVQVYRYDGAGGFELAQELELSSSNGDVGAEILVSADGKFVYGSSRGTGVVLVYQLEADNSLIKIQEYNLAGVWPRSMAIRDNMMVVIDKNGPTVQLLEIDTTTGMISGNPDNVYPTPDSPSFVDFMD